MKCVLNNGFVAVLFLLCTLNAAHAEKFTAEVIYVMDGDTVLLLRDNLRIKVRLAEIDAPEITQAFGAKSRQSLAKLVLNKQVHVDSRAEDVYGRLVARIKVGELNVNHEQVKRGMAWEYSRSSNRKVLRALQNDAMKEKRGLWAQSNPIPPRKWRKTHAASRQYYAVKNNLCGSKRYCSQMNGCDEAIFYLSNCNARSLDKNRDGVPCESLCRAKK